MNLNQSLFLCLLHQIDGKKTVGLEAFSRIASACALVADPITVHNLFDALTSSSGGRLHFLIYDKYLKRLCKVLKSMKHIYGRPESLNVSLADGEIILEVDAKLSVYQHRSFRRMFLMAGRLTLTSHALYFEASGTGTSNYDLSKDLKQVVNCELTGPWGARFFDNAIICKSDSVVEPIVFEFSGHSHRDYWFAIIREVLHANKFIRKYKLKRFQRAESLSKAALGIFRSRAVKEAFHRMPSHFKSILPFSLAEKLPKGDKILEALYNHFELMRIRFQNHDGLVTASYEKQLTGPLSDSLYTLTRMGFLLPKKEDNPEENGLLVDDFHVGETSPLQLAIRESVRYSGRVEEARATLYQVKVEDIDTNLAAIKDLLFPLFKIGKLLQLLAAWEDPFKSRIFLFLILYLLYRGWVRYILPCFFLSVAVYMFWHKHHSSGKPIKVFQVTPPNRNPVELLLMLQEGVSQLQTNVQTGTISLLKLRALLLAAFPKTTQKVAVAMVIAAVGFTLVPFSHILTLVLLEVYTRKMPVRRESSEKLVRRIKEWWSRVPAAPIQIGKTMRRAQ
ncbi:hypothetical protein BHM03_00015642 [Ensete ventricosum]|nr:hypothetical protein BHM03_00015642 [Ensete ventricosum]